MPVDSTLQTSKVAGSAEEHLVLFTLCNEYYGVDIARVREVNEVQEITKLPQSPPFIEGVINLRGDITPVMNLRKRLGLPQTETEQETRIMVVQVGDQGLGLLVDDVREVIKVPSEAIVAPSQFVTTERSKFLRSIAKIENRLVVLFDLDKLLTVQELDELNMAEPA